jgi:hypothetical protein
MGKKYRTMEGERERCERDIEMAEQECGDLKCEGGGGREGNQNDDGREKQSIQ